MPLDRYPQASFQAARRSAGSAIRARRSRSPTSVADEPWSCDLDVSVQAPGADLLVSARKIGIAHAVHQPTTCGVAAAQSVTEVLVMQKGVSVEHGPRARVLAAPRHDYTRI